MKRIKIKKQKTIISIIITVIILLIIYFVYTFFPIQKSYKSNIHNNQQWIAYIQDLNNWCGPNQPKLYIYEDGSYIIKNYNLKEIDKGKIKTHYNIEKNINKLKNKNKSNSGINYYIKFKDGSENIVNIITTPKLSHYINKIPNIKEKLNSCK